MTIHEVCARLKEPARFMIPLGGTTYNGVDLAAVADLIAAAIELAENVRLGYGGPNTKACLKRLNDALARLTGAESEGENG